MSDPALATLKDDPPGQWVKLFPAFSESTSEGPVGRVYTIRKFDASTNVLTIDAVMHGDGIVSSWLKDCKAGDQCDVAGPRGGFRGTGKEYERMLFVGDQTSMPAISAIMEQLPTYIRTRALIEVPDADSAQTDLACPEQFSWFRADVLGDDIERAMVSDAIVWCGQKRSTYIWAAGEAGRMRSLRRAFLNPLSLEPSDVLTVGYWKAGDKDHRDAAAG